jgi:hypothetical protein
LRKKRQGQRVKAEALNERPNGPSRCSRLLQQNLPTGDSCAAANWTLLIGEMGVADYLWLVRGNTILNFSELPRRACPG